MRFVLIDRGTQHLLCLLGCSAIVVLVSYHGYLMPSLELTKVNAKGGKKLIPAEKDTLPFALYMVPRRG